MVSKGGGCTGSRLAIFSCMSLGSSSDTCISPGRSRSSLLVLRGTHLPRFTAAARPASTALREGARPLRRWKERRAPGHPERPKVHEGLALEQAPRHRHPRRRHEGLVRPHAWGRPPVPLGGSSTLTALGSSALSAGPPRHRRPPWRPQLRAERRGPRGHAPRRAVPRALPRRPAPPPLCSAARRPCRSPGSHGPRRQRRPAPSRDSSPRAVLLPLAALRALSGSATVLRRGNCSRLCLKVGGRLLISPS